MARAKRSFSSFLFVYLIFLQRLLFIPSRMLWVFCQIGVEVPRSLSFTLVAALCCWVHLGVTAGRALERNLRHRQSCEPHSRLGQLSADSSLRPHVAGWRGADPVQAAVLRDEREESLRASCAAWTSDAAADAFMAQDCG